GTRRRILARLPRADRLTHEIGQLAGAPEWLAAASSNNRRCNLFSKPFFAIVADDLPYLLFFCARQPFGGAWPRARIHAHVERTVGAKREAARRVVELRRGHAEVEEHAVRSRHAGLVERLAQAGE